MIIKHTGKNSYHIEAQTEDELEHLDWLMRNLEGGRDNGGGGEVTPQLGGGNGPKDD